MRNACGLCIAVAVLAACRSNASTSATAPSDVQEVSTPLDGSTFSAALSGAQEVPPVDTPASGHASVWVQADGSQLRYEIEVKGLAEITMAHLHLAPRGQNGPLFVWLYPPAPPPKLIKGPLTGTLARGVVTARNLTGPMQGNSIADVVDKIRAGDVYVNVHTQTHPEGELRGQLH